MRLKSHPHDPVNEEEWSRLIHAVEMMPAERGKQVSGNRPRDQDEMDAEKEDEVVKV